MLYVVSTITIVVYLTEHAKSQAPSPEFDIFFNLHAITIYLPQLINYYWLSSSRYIRYMVL